MLGLLYPLFGLQPHRRADERHRMDRHTFTGSFSRLGLLPSEATAALLPGECSTSHLTHTQYLELSAGCVQGCRAQLLIRNDRSAVEVAPLLQVQASALSFSARTSPHGAQPIADFGGALSREQRVRLNQVRWACS